MGGGKERRRERAREKEWDLKKESKTKEEGEISILTLRPRTNPNTFPKETKPEERKATEMSSLLTPDLISHKQNTAIKKKHLNKHAV